MKKLLFILLLLSFAYYSLCSKHLHKEKDYQKYFANFIKGQMEFVLPDKTRIDILTEIYAIEIDFANKWAESIGQALYYSLMIDKKPGIVLIIENPKKEQKYISRLIYILKDLNNKGYEFNLWIIDKDFKINKVEL